MVHQTLECPCKAKWYQIVKIVVCGGMPRVGGEAFSVKKLLGICSCLLINGSSAYLLILVSCNVLQMLHTNLLKFFILVLVLNEFLENYCSQWVYETAIPPKCLSTKSHLITRCWKQYALRQNLSATDCPSRISNL